MSAPSDLSKLSVIQFAEKFRGDMIPLSNTFSYFCASVPLSDEDLKEYLEEPVASLPPAIGAQLPRISIILVPYLEKPAPARRARTRRRNTSPSRSLPRTASPGTRTSGSATRLCWCSR